MKKVLDKFRPRCYYIGALRDSGPPEGGAEKKDRKKTKKFLTKPSGCDIIAELLERKRKSVPCKLNNVKHDKAP